MAWPEMPPPRLPPGGDTDEFRLGHIADRARMAREFTEGRSRGDLEADKKLAWALSKVISDVGEAARHVSEEFRKAHPEVPWGELMRVQEQLLAELGRFDRDILWRMATERLPEVSRAVERMLAADRGR